MSVFFMFNFLLIKWEHALTYRKKKQIALDTPNFSTKKGGKRCLTSYLPFGGNSLY